jgi:hypothetical protein
MSSSSTLPVLLYTVWHTTRQEAWMMKTLDSKKEIVVWRAKQYTTRQEAWMMKTLDSKKEIVV